MSWLLQRPAVFSWLAVIACCWCGSAAGAEPAAADLEFFETEVRPLLADHCSECHSARTGDPEGGLSFDSRADFFAVGVAVARDLDASLLVQAVRYDGSLQMPPAGRLPDEAIAVLEEWVRRGLPWPDDGRAAAGPAFDLATRKAEHWCWQPPQRAALPEVRDPSWCRDEIDRFVLARLEAAGLEPAAEAPRPVLVRRAAEILTGLPADPAAVAAVAGDPNPEAFERYVDGLLASPHFGERFARHWLDAVRYAESRGHEFDFDIPNAWRYRDWVVAAFNDDLPYDQFICEQIAGDLVAEPRLDPRGGNQSVIGTGFWFLGEDVHSPVDTLQDEADRIDNRIDTFGKAFLGLPLGCARCHDHKFDAISTADYYALAGMLMSSSYRQVPFESLEHNRAVAAEAEDSGAASRAEILSLVADLLEAIELNPADLLPPAEELARAAAAGGPGAGTELLIADYTRSTHSTPIIGDAAAWGSRAVHPGEPILDAAADGLAERVQLEPLGRAVSDAIWSKTVSHGGREPGAIGGIDRAGRVLRTPNVRITGGILWHRVRGRLQIFTPVDGHLLVHGPLHGQMVMTIDTQGRWEWIRQDLRRDLRWDDTAHTLHVEYAAIDGRAEVAEVVAASDKPQRPDPLAVAILARGDDPTTAARKLLAEAVAACRSGRLDSPALACLCDRLLRSAAIDWSQGPARRLADATARAAASRATVFARAKLESAIAPAMLDGNGIDQFVLMKGSAARPGPLAPRRFLEAIDGPDQVGWPAHSSGRLELAERVIDPRNPLTARVAVNRIWHHLFGRGLVATPDNFGKLGEPAADPLAQALLDTLATRFVAQGWSVKRLVREIVTSSTWRMGSTPDPIAEERDPLNLLLHRAPLRRLEAEAIRDKILAASGRLDRRIGGPSVPVHLEDFHAGRGRPESGPLDGGGRRSLYTAIRRNFLPGFLLAFDFPVPFQAMGRRTVTNVPAQSLALMNDPFVAEQAARWADTALADPDLPAEARIAQMYRAAFARDPAPAETAAAVAFLADQTACHDGDFAIDPRQAAAWADLAHALINAKEFSFVP